MAAGILDFCPTDKLPENVPDPPHAHLWGDDLIELQNLVRSWVFPIPARYIDAFNEWLRMEKDGMKDHSWIIDIYAKMIEPHAEELGFLDDMEHSEEVLTSGLFCFLGQLIFYYSQYGTQSIPGQDPSRTLLSRIQTIFDFSLLYIHVDHYLDNVKLNPEEKSATLGQMFLLIHDPTCMPAPPRMEGLVEAYRRLLEDSPEAKDVLIKLFMTEVACIKLQTDSTLSRQDYIHITEIKGGRTATAIQAILGDKLTPEGYQIGACVQLLDDLMDVYADLDAGVWTLATHDLKKYGILDNYLLYTARRIVGLDSRFTIFKFLMMEILTYSISQHDCFSPTIKRRLRSSMHLRYDKGSKMMNIVNSWLRHYITEIRQNKPT